MQKQPQPNWMEMEKQIQSAPKQTYPRKNKTQQERNNDWITKQEEWSNAPERQTMGYNIQKTQSIQKRIEQLKRRMHGQVKK